MSQKKIILKFNLLSGLIVFSFLTRLISVYFFRDAYVENEWGILLDNLINYKSYSFYIFDGQPIPSAYMPPLYAFFLYLIKITTSFNESNLLYTVFFIQIILSTCSVYFFYRINQNFFSNKLSIINSAIFSIIPLNIYTCGQVSSITLQIVLSLLFLWFLLILINNQKNKNIILFSLFSGLLVLTRGEFILIFILTIFFIAFYKKTKLINLVKINMIVFLIISPYVVRNYIHFNEIFIVKSLGYNLWKGNNQLSLVEGYENLNNIKFTNLKDKIDNLKKNDLYEINRDKVFLNEASTNLSTNPTRYFALFFKKIFSYYFIDLNSNYPNYYNIFHILPVFLISLLSFPGLFIFYKNSKFERKCVSLYLFLNLLVFSVFFILPRYKLIILPIQIILAVYFILYIMRKYGYK